MSKEVKKKSPGIDIVIPTYNGAGHIPKLLDSIKKQNYRNYKCYVIDDYSKDSTVAIIKENYPWVRLIEQNQNNGPAMNRNIAIGLGTNPYIGIFDDDTYLKDPDWLKKAMCKMENNPNIGQLGAMIISGYDENILLDCGISGSGYLFGGLFHQENIAHVDGKHLIPRRALGACSAGTVMRRNVFENAGGFDSKYFYPSEDLDLSLRIHLMGYDVFYEPSLITFHFESQAMGKNNRQKIFMHRRNCLLTFVENYPLKQIVIALSILFLNKIIISPLSLKFRKYKKRNQKLIQEEIADYRKSFKYLLKNFSLVYRKRKYFDQVRTRPRKYLLEIR
jgi:GT2 family glycosyltransferase